jgi:hypothetical protein
MYSNNLNIDFKNHCNIFAKEAFSKREAWNWLLNNVYKEESQCSVKASLRILAQEWQWPKTKVARFLKDLTSTKLIEIENHSSYSLIKLIKNNNQKIISLDIFSINQAQPLGTEAGTETGTVIDTAQAQAIQDVEENLKTASGTLNGTESQKVAFSSTKINQLGQKRDNFGTENGAAQTKAVYELQTSLKTETGTIPGQYRDSDGFSEAEKKEKKKRSKKRKEKNTKEKYSLKGIQKERYESFQDEENNSILPTEPELLAANPSSREISQCLKARKSIERVEVNDVAFWAENNLPAAINLEWELAKFQDYYRASHKKTPKDGVAAFLNWLRKGAEFKSLNENNKNLNAGENLNGRCKTYQNETYGSRFKETTGFERFITGGLRAVG